MEVSALHFLSDDKKSISTQKVLSSLWKSRNDNSVVNKLADLLSIFVTEKCVYDEIEFYLPQIVHLSIQLNPSGHNQSLENLILCICRCSIHSALQVTFMLVAAMEDYQPEDKSGVANPSSNFVLFSRCAKLIENVELAVVYGYANTSMSSVLEDIQPITAANRAHAAQFSTKIMSGTLLFKRNVAKNMFYSKIWKKRHFVIENRILYCYHDENTILRSPLRAFPLTEECEIIELKVGSKHPFLFELVNQSTELRYLIRAPTEVAYRAWINAISSQITLTDPPSDTLSQSLDPMMNASSDSRDSFLDPSIKSASDFTSNRSRPEGKEWPTSYSQTTLTPIQKKKQKILHQQRSFITELTDICEKLRFLEKDVRKIFLKRYMTDLMIPPFVYLPLCSSLDTFSYVLRSVPRECYAFTTKARCPALMIFEMEERSDGLDVASFLTQDISDYNDSELMAPPHLTFIPPIDKSTKQIPDSKELHDTLPSKYRESIASNFMDIWTPDGTGLAQLELLTGKQSVVRMPVSPRRVGTGFSHAKSSRFAAVNSATSQHASKALMNTETFEIKAARVRETSPYGHLSGWKLDGLIAKSNDDVRQEVFMMQLIVYFKKIFEDAKVDVWLYTYRILSTSKSTGLIQLITNSMSIDGLKKKDGFPGSLRQYFEQTYGQPETPAFQTAVREFVKSMAGYSIVTYLLGIKDRHNGNVMIDASGHIIHIDFGFVLGLAPGKAFSLEKAPFKLTKELADVMGGIKSAYFNEYVKLCGDALLVARKHCDSICTIMEIMKFESAYPAFRYNSNAIKDFVGRLQLSIPDGKVHDFAKQLVTRSYDHMGTGMYDSFQLSTNGIAK